MHIWRSLPQGQLSAVMAWLLARRPAAKSQGAAGSPAIEAAPRSEVTSPR